MDILLMDIQVPMIRSPTCDFSYAGLKTAVLRTVQHHAPGLATDANRQVGFMLPFRVCCGLVCIDMARNCHCFTPQAVQLSQCPAIARRCAQTLQPVSNWRQSSSWSSGAGAALPGRERRAPTSRALWLAYAATCHVVQLTCDSIRHPITLPSARLTSFHSLVHK